MSTLNNSVVYAVVTNIQNSMPNIDLQILEPEFDWFGFVHGLIVSVIFEPKDLPKVHFVEQPFHNWLFPFSHALFQPYKTQTDSNCFVCNDTEIKFNMFTINFNSPVAFIPSSKTRLMKYLL